MRIPILILYFFVLFFVSCDKELIIDKNYIDVIEQDFNYRKNINKSNELFDVFENYRLSVRQHQAMKFLYAYMPLSDIIDYPFSFHLKNVNITLSLMSKLKWVKDIPDDIYLHYVLPLRVSGEYLDESRATLFSELYSRVKELSMYEAALEATHWRYEKSMHKYVDSRASSPLATISAAYGGNNDNAILTVAALRAIGIPARLVSAAHLRKVDNVQIWVEVWVDGKWYYIDTGLPVSKLKEPKFSKNNILVQTKVFGKSLNEKYITQQSGNYTKVNLTENYEKVSKIIVEVVDKKDNAVQGAEVVFYIYDNSTILPVYTEITNAKGNSELILGVGDVVVWACKGDSFGFKVVNTHSTKNIKIVLSKTIEDKYSGSLELTQTVEIKENVAHEDDNYERVKRGTEIRNNYISTFMTSADAKKMAKELGYNTTIISDLIKRSRGNWAVISDFLHKSNKNKGRAITLLGLITDKDIRDITAKALDDHYEFSPPLTYRNLYNSYVLNPRIADEIISPYKEGIQKAFSKKQIEQYKKSPNDFVKWVKDSITVYENANTYNVPISPLGVYRSRIADARSRDMFFVAACRAFGITARIEKVSGNVQYFTYTSWKTVNFEGKHKIGVLQGQLLLSYKAGVSNVSDPIYGTHFSVYKYENGKFKVLDFWNSEAAENPATFISIFNNKIRLDNGYYMLTTNHKMNSGKVLSTIKMFNIVVGKKTYVDMNLG